MAEIPTVKCSGDNRIRKEKKNMNKLNLTKGKITGYIIAVVVTAICAVLTVMLNSFDKVELVSTYNRTFEKATVVKVTKDNLQEDGERYGNQEVVLRMKTGSYSGQDVSAISPNGNLFGAACTAGLDVIAIVSANNSGDPVVTVYSRDREYVVYVFVALFILMLWLVGGRKGLKSAACLALTFVLTLFVYFPLVYRGFSPFWAAALICVASTVITIFFVAGANVKSVSAIAGTAFGVLVAGVLALVFGQLAGISGYNVSEVESLLFIGQNIPIDIGGLLFSGILISTLGAVMDVGMSLASTIDEIHERKPELSVSELFKSGINVGRDMMGTMSNTLILAFVGGSIVTLMIDYCYDLSYYQLINSNNICIEIMQGLSGTIGIVLTVPFTSLLTAVMIKKYHKKKEQAGEDGISE